MGTYLTPPAPALVVTTLRLQGHVLEYMKDAVVVTNPNGKCTWLQTI